MARNGWVNLHNFLPHPYFSLSARLSLCYTLARKQKDVKPVSSRLRMNYRQQIQRQSDTKVVTLDGSRVAVNERPETINASPSRQFLELEVTNDE